MVNLGIKRVEGGWVSAGSIEQAGELSYWKNDLNNVSAANFEDELHQSAYS